MDNLFEGLQILGPDELESSLTTPAADKDEDGSLKVGNEGFSIEPVTQTAVVEEKEKETTEDKSVTTTTATNNNPKGEQIKALIKDLVKEGVLSVEDEEELDKIEGNFDTIKSLAEKTLESRLKEKEENWKRGFSGAKKRFLEIEDAFSDADQAVIMAQRLEFFSTVDETKIKGDQALQRQLYFEQLKSKGFSDQEAAESVTEAESLNKLEDKALKAFPELKDKATEVVEKNRLSRQEATAKQAKEQEEAFNKLFTTIEEKKSFVEGLDLNKTVKDKLKANITKVVHKDEKTGRELNSLMYKQSQNPVEFELLINYLDVLGVFNFDEKSKSFKPDISKLKTVAKSAAVRELDKVFENEDRRIGGAENSSPNIEGKLSFFREAFGNK